MGSLTASEKYSSFMHQTCYIILSRMHLSTFYRRSDAILLICLIAGVKYQHKDTLCNFRLNGAIIPEPALYETNKKDHGTSDGTKCSRAHYPTIFKYMYLELKMKLLYEIILNSSSNDSVSNLASSVI